jgi:hypothetical protein
MASSTLESWRSPGRRGHGTTSHGLRERSSRGSSRIEIVASSLVVYVASFVEFGTVVFVVSGLPLTVVEIFLVEGTDTVGTLLGVVGRVLWGQGAYTESQPAGIAAVVVVKGDIEVLLGFFVQLRLLVMVGLVSFRSVNVDRQLRFAFVTVITSGDIAGRQRDTREWHSRRSLRVQGRVVVIGKREVQAFFMGRGVGMVNWRLGLKVQFRHWVVVQVELRLGG